LLAGLLALGAHLGLWATAQRREPSLETWAARVAALIHEDLAGRAPVAIEPPPPPQPEVQPQPEPAIARAAPADVEHAPRPEPRAASRPETPPAARALPPGHVAPPAESGRIISEEAEPAGPVDLTDNTFVTGTASAYVGGASASAGTNRVAVPSGLIDPDARPTTTPGRLSRARPVELSGSEWRCDWPASAVAQDIYEQFVALRVVVRADGSVERATVLSDPGNGFGAAAVACARRTRFSPARDASGKAIRASSPPIRVRFTR
jgi:protein TonB